MNKLVTIIAICFLGLSYAQESRTVQKRIHEIDLKCDKIDASKSFRVDSFPTMESTEGGISIWTFDGNQLVKYESVIYGEMGKIRSSYYLKNAELIFVHEEETQYNRPIYYDSLAMVENDDNEFWNPDKFGLRIVNAYFQDTTIIHFTEGGNSGLLSNEAYMMEVSNNYRSAIDNSQEEYALFRRVLEMRPSRGCN